MSKFWFFVVLFIFTAYIPVHFLIDLNSFISSAATLSWDAQFHVAKVYDTIGKEVPFELHNPTSFDSYPGFVHFVLAILSLWGFIDPHTIFTLVLFILTYVLLPAGVAFSAFEISKNKFASYFSLLFYFLIFSHSSYIMFQGLLPQVFVLTGSVWLLFFVIKGWHELVPLITLSIVLSHRFGFFYLLPIVFVLLLRHVLQKPNLRKKYDSFYFMMLIGSMIMGFAVNIVGGYIPNMSYEDFLVNSVPALNNVGNILYDHLIENINFITTNTGFANISFVNLFSWNFLAWFFIVGFLYYVFRTKILSKNFFPFLFSFSPLLFFSLDSNARVMIIAVPFFCIMAGCGFYSLLANRLGFGPHSTSAGKRNFNVSKRPSNIPKDMWEGYLT